ncbi:hypothetical protein BH11PSE8_BH11PSE8_48320 [soil metagenome]
MATGALADCRACVVVIGRCWLQSGDHGEPPRLHQAGDLVRAEIEALIAGRKAILPVLVEGDQLPEASELPETLGGLLRFQALTIGNGDWATTSGQLVREIEALRRSRGTTLLG